MGDLDHFLEIQIVIFLWLRLKTGLLIGVWTLEAISCPLIGWNLNSHCVACHASQCQEHLSLRLLTNACQTHLGVVC